MDTTKEERTGTKITYEELRQRHFGEMLERFPAFAARATWPPERLKAERERLLRELVRTARLKSAWHRRRLAGVDPERLREEDLAELPVMTKTDLMANYDDILTDPRLSLGLIEQHLHGLTDDAYLLDYYHAIASGGSSGQRGVYVYSWGAWMMIELASRRARAHWTAANLPPRPMVAVTVAAENATHLSASLLRTFAPPSVYDYHNVPITPPLARIVAELNRVQPYTLRGYPSAMRLFVEEARAGRLMISPKVVALGGEPLLPEIRQDIKATWPATIFDNYGCSEMGWLASGCGEGIALHVPKTSLSSNR